MTWRSETSCPGSPGPAWLQEQRGGAEAAAPVLVSHVFWTRVDGFYANPKPFNLGHVTRGRAPRYRPFRTEVHFNFAFA